MQRGEVTWLSGLKSHPRPTMHPQLPVHRHQQHRGERGHWAKRARLHPPCPSGQRCGTTPKGTGRGRWPFPSPASGPFFQDLLSRKACRLSSGNPSCAVSHHQSEQSGAKPPPCPHCHRLPEMRCHCLLPAGTKGHPPPQEQRQNSATRCRTTPVTLTWMLHGRRVSHGTRSSRGCVPLSLAFPGRGASRRQQ